jgi:hypothetical protein
MIFNSKFLAIGVFIVALGASSSYAAPACDPDNGGIKLPEGFCALVAIDETGAARHMAVAANGDVYVALQGGRAGKGGVMALRDTNGDGKLDAKDRLAQRLSLHCDPDHGRALQDDAGPVETLG